MNKSRREFLQSIIPKVSSDTLLNPDEPIQLESKQPLSRRTFLNLIVSIAVVAAANRKRDQDRAEFTESTPPAPQTNDSTEPPAASQLPTNEPTEPTLTEQANSVLETVAQNSLVTVAKVVATNIFNYLKIENGNKSMNDDELIEYLKHNPIEGAVRFCGIAPVVEEALFRLIPDMVFAKGETDVMRWDIGVPSSVIFALVHNFYEDEEDGKRMKFAADSIPISQFMGGLFYWYLMREKGVNHSILAHSMFNSIPYTIGYALFQAYPEQRAEQKVRKLLSGKD